MTIEIQNVAILEDKHFIAAPLETMELYRDVACSLWICASWARLTASNVIAQGCYMTSEPSIRMFRAFRLLLVLPSLIEGLLGDLTISSVIHRDCRRI